jgi:hypothetical protein
MTTLNTRPGTFTVRQSRPDCDIHKHVLRTPQETPTIVDGKTLSGPWANMCKACWGEHSTCTLGTGAGQMIYAPLTDNEVLLHESLPSGDCWGCDPRPVPNTTGRAGRLFEHDVWCAWLNSDMLPRAERVAF